MTQQTRDAQATVDEILFDGRALQHHARTPGRLADFDVALVSAIRHHAWPGARPRLVGVVDGAAEPLREHHRLLFDEVTTGRYRAGRRARCFISSAPMAHDPVWALPILLDMRILKVAALHELISAGPPSDLGRRADHLTCFAWLGRYDLFAVVSHRVKAELERLRAIDPSRIVITGQSIREGFDPRPTDLPIPFGDRRHIAVVVDDGEGADLDRALTAHAHFAARHRLPIVLLGPCPPEMRGRLRAHYGREGGVQDDLTFADGQSDEDVRDLYRRALLTVLPSWGSEASAASALESAALGTPAVVPEAGQRADETIIPAFAYQPGDPGALARLLDAIAVDVALWNEARAAGMAEGALQSTGAAASRLLGALVARMADLPRVPGVGRGVRPRLAMLTPLPPATSGAPARSAATIAGLSRHVDVQAFSDTPGAASGIAGRPVAPFSALELGLQDFDASLCVLGHSGRHAAIFAHLLAQGGAALTQDAHLAGFYAETLGLDRALDVGCLERGGAVMQDEIAEWVREPRDMPILFMSEVARAAAPLLVTSDIARREISRLYGIEPKRLPPLQHRTFDAALLASEQRRIRREALGWTWDDVVLCSFGLGFSAAAVVVWALRLLRDWRLDARLVLCGCGNDADRARIDHLAQELELGQWIAQSPDRPSGRASTDHLVAADMAVQLGTHPLSGPSEAMMDCIAASLPTIANDHIAHTVEAPAFVRRVPDALSPVLVAEAALEILSSGQHRLRPLKAARAFADAHSPDLYACAMMDALGLDR